MKYKSRAITLTYIKQGDSSIISKIFTEEKGLQTFIIKNIRSKKSKKKLSHFEPLTLLNIDADFNNKNSLQYLGEVSIGASLNKKTNKLYKSFIGFFISEVSSRILQDNEQSVELFNFLWDTSIKLYTERETDVNFALKYLIDLSKYLGFYPSKIKIKKPFFDLESGEFTDDKKNKNLCLDKEMTGYLKDLINKKDVTIPQQKKSKLLKKLLYYYKLHHYNLDSITSHLVIETLRR